MASKDGLVHMRKVVSHFVPLPRDLPTDALPTPGPILEWTRQTLQNMFDGDGPTEVTTDDASPAVDFSLYSKHPVVFLKEL